MRATEPDKQFVLVGNRMYDVTSFKHPGGSIMQRFFGTSDKTKARDATDAWTSFHARSDKARRWLKARPSEPFEPSSPQSKATQSILEDYRKLEAELRAEGLFDPCVPHVVMRCVEIIAMFILGVWLVHAGWSISGICILGLAQGRSGWVQHEGGHRSLTGIIPVDSFIQLIFIDLGLGVASSWWNSFHNQHHAGAQHLEHDPDIHTLPLAAFNKEISKRMTKGLWWLYIQAYMLPVITTLMITLMWQFVSHPLRLKRTLYMPDIFLLLLRPVIIYFVFRQFPLSSIMLGYLASTWVMSNYLWLQFALSHTFTPEVESENIEDWVTNASLHTVNIYQSWWCDWMMGYLNFQIEHHLFPSLPQFRSAQAAPKVRALLARYDLPYMYVSYWEAYRLMFSNLHQVGMDEIALRRKDVKAE
eukprot:85520_1